MNYRTKEFRTWTLGGVTYTRKADVVSKFQQVKKGNRDDSFMFDLLSRHPDVPDTGILEVRFVKHDTDSFGDLGMMVFLEGGGVWEYPSYKACLVPDRALEIDSGADWYARYFAQKEAPTMRMIIQYQLDEFREERRGGDDTCDMCGVPTYDGDVDHIVPFKEVYLSWLEKVGLSPGDVVFKTVSVDGMKHIADEKLNDSWEVHHQINFDPQWLCKPCHRSKK